MSERINIAPQAKRFKAVGYTSPYDGFRTDPISKHDGFLREDTLTTWKKIKPEVNALQAVLIDDLVGRTMAAREHRPPFGLINHITGEPIDRLDLTEPFEDLNTRMAYTLYVDLNDQLRDIIENGDKRLLPMLQRLHKVYLGIRPGGLADTEGIIQSGINTAVHVVSGVLRVIPELEQDNESMNEIANNSYPLVAKLAMKNVVEAISFLHKIGRTHNPNTGYKPEFFTIVGKSPRRRLDLSPKGEEVLEEEIATRENNERFRNEITTGCPAMVNFGDESPVKKIYDWGVDLTTQHIYPKLSRVNSVK